MSDFLNKSVSMYPIKLKNGIAYRTNNTFQNIIFLISANLPLIFENSLLFKNAFFPDILTHKHKRN